MLMQHKVNRKTLKNILLALAFLQPVALALDIVESSFILRWLNHPINDDDFSIYHNIVIAKWLIALTGGLVAIACFLFTKAKVKIQTKRPG